MYSHGFRDFLPPSILVRDRVRRIAHEDLREALILLLTARPSTFSTHRESVLSFAFCFSYFISIGTKSWTSSFR